MKILCKEKRYTTSNLCAALLLLWSAAGALPYLQGRVTLAGDTTGIDSVKVASKKYRTSTFTDKNGYYSLGRPVDTTCHPETTTVDTAYQHTVRLSLHSRKQTISRNSSVPVTVSLYDLKGRLIDRTPSSLLNQQFPQSRHSNGIILMSIDNMHPQPIMVLDHLRSRYYKKTRVFSPVLQYPECTTDDTIYFYKNDYFTTAAAARQHNSGVPQALRRKRWSAFDLHSHTLLTDGSYPLDALLINAFDSFGLYLYANSEHGGTAASDTNGNAISINPYHTDAPAPNSDINISRWYSLIHFAWPKVLNQRKIYPDKEVLLGLEWNNPTHEHVSIGFINDAEQPTAVSAFEYRFDANDPDTSKGRELKQNASHNDAVAALRWLQQNHPATSYCFVNHPSRENSGPNPIGMFRDFHNAAPEVFLGLEGMPGHQKYYIRGKFSQTDKPTRGGADPTIAVIGGLWDALLGEGRHLWIIVNSDFHDPSQDFWPGEYAKTWVATRDTGTQAWLNGVHSGEMFITHGDLVRDLEFTIGDGANRVGMGGDLTTLRPTVEIEIRFRSPSVNHHGDSVRVDHLDLISGTISGRISEENQAAYNNPTNATTRLAARFFPSDWSVDNGWNVIRAHIYCSASTYFRLRGTSLAIGTSGEVDSYGNPLPDAMNGNTEAVAWRDLWFYSNPIFVYLQ